MQRNNDKVLLIAAWVVLIGLICAYTKGKLAERHRWHLRIDSLLEEKYQDGVELGERNQELHDTVREGSSI